MSEHSEHHFIDTPEPLPPETLDALDRRADDALERLAEAAQQNQIDLHHTTVRALVAMARECATAFWSADNERTLRRKETEDYETVINTLRAERDRLAAALEEVAEYFDRNDDPRDWPPFARSVKAALDQARGGRQE